MNEDANVKLIRELRAEIDRLRASLDIDSIDLIDPNTRKKLAVKEAQERHLTEEWTEKWKEAAKILDEHKALALKQTGRFNLLNTAKEVIYFCHYVIEFGFKREEALENSYWNLVIFLDQMVLRAFLSI